MQAMPNQTRPGEISVVIPTYNRAELLAKTLRSIERQSLAPAEVIVVDDGSTDDTDRLLAAGKAIVVSNPGGGWGPARARNAGLNRASGEFVAFVDSDDLIPPEAFRALHRALTDAPEAPFAYGRGLAALETNGDWQQQGLIAPTPEEMRKPLQSLFVRNRVPASGALVRAEAARSVGGYDVSIVWSEDHDFWLRLSMRAAGVYVPELVCVYRRHLGNRHTPLASGDESIDYVTRIAEVDPRLPPVIPDRFGVLFAEAAANAVSQRRPLSATRLLWSLGVSHPKRIRTLRSALNHQRLRRASAAAGESLWSTRSDLRDWLSDF